MNTTLMDERVARVVIPPRTTFPVVNPALESETVRVELVWAEERGAKDDCKGGTKVLWARRGDVQDYPAKLWHRLAPHPDVWRLVDPAADAPKAECAAQAIYESGAQAVERLNKANQALPSDGPNGPYQAALDARAQAAQEARATGAETNTDVVVIDRGGIAEMPPHLTTDLAAGLSPHLPTRLDAARLASMSDYDVRGEAEKRGYDLHPRLGTSNLRAKFLQAQAQADNETN